MVKRYALITYCVWNSNNVFGLVTSHGQCPALKATLVQHFNEYTTELIFVLFLCIKGTISFGSREIAFVALSFPAQGSLPMSLMFVWW